MKSRLAELQLCPCCFAGMVYATVCSWLPCPLLPQHRFWATTSPSSLTPATSTHAVCCLASFRSDTSYLCFYILKSLHQLHTCVQRRWISVVKVKLVWWKVFLDLSYFNSKFQPWSWSTLCLEYFNGFPALILHLIRKNITTCRTEYSRVGRMCLRKPVIFSILIQCLWLVSF